MFWNKTITLYNRHQDALTDEIAWHRHTIRNCFFKSARNNVRAGSTQTASNDNVARIPAQDNFVPANEWNALPVDKRGKYITLQVGDVIVLGDINEDIDEYANGKRSSDLIAKHELSGSMFVDSYNINDFLPGAHYFVRGK